MFNDPSLVGSWPKLTVRLDTNDVVRHWATTEPELSGLDDVAGLLRAWGNPARTGEVLTALTRLAAVDGGADDDAVLLLLHLLSGVVWRLVGQLADLSPDITVIVLGELTCQIRTYRWRTRHGSVVTNLEKDTRRGVLADLHPSSRYHPERVERLTWDGDVEAARAEAPSDTGEEDLDVVDLLLWAARSGVSEADIVLLVETECARGHYGSRADDAVAGRHGITRRTLYRRRERTLTALRGAAKSYLAAVA